MTESEKSIHVPTEESRRQVEAMAGYGLDDEAICVILAISEDALAQGYQSSLHRGRAQAEAKIRQALFNTALGGGKNAVKAMDLWLKQNAGGY